MGFPISQQKIYVINSDHSTDSARATVHHDALEVKSSKSSESLVVETSYIPKSLDMQFNSFLQFVKDSDAAEYREYTRNQMCGPISWLYIVLTVAIFLIRGNFQSIFYQGPLFCFSMVVCILTIMLLFLYAWERYVKTFEDNIFWKPVKDTLTFVVMDVCHDELESLICFLVSVSYSLTLISRVLAGGCPLNISPFKSTSCNPQAVAHIAPLYGIIGCYVGFLCVQIFIKRVRKWVMVLCWCIGFFTVLWSILYFGEKNQVFGLMYSLFFLLIAYEFERVQMSIFLKNKLALEAEKFKRIELEIQYAETTKMIGQLNEAKQKEEKSQHDLEIYELTAENDVKLMELEANQLRSLMGNVAHDLKTPIHSIVMDLEVLKKCYTKILIQMQQRITSDASDPDYVKIINQCEKGITTSSNSSEMNFEKCDPITIFESLEATCAFMMMGINRSLDFMKASSNITLLPVLETFEIVTALITPVTCMKHHLDEDDQTRINIHPLSTDLCPYIVSDKNWLNENILCLLSNAMKYSDKNTPVDLYITLISESSITCDITNDVMRQDDEAGLQTIPLRNEMMTSTEIPTAVTNHINKRLSINSTTGGAVILSEPEKIHGITKLKQQRNQQQQQQQQLANELKNQKVDSSNNLVKNFVRRLSRASSFLLPTFNVQTIVDLELNLNQYCQDNKSPESSIHSSSDSGSSSSSSSSGNESSISSTMETSLHKNHTFISNRILRNPSIPLHPNKQQDSIASRMMIRVSVEDRGIGISPEMRQGLFRPFKQAQRMAVGGTGLGLFSLYKRVEALQGVCGINCRSDGQTGSVFWFAFPYFPDPTIIDHGITTTTTTQNDVNGTSISELHSELPFHNITTPATCISSDSISSPSSFENNKSDDLAFTKVHSQANLTLPSLVISSINMPPLRILLVDDSSSILKITSRSLRLNGHIVHVEVNGNLGLERLKNAYLTQEFDLLLTDLQMPVMDGFEFVKIFRKFEEEEILISSTTNTHNISCVDAAADIMSIGSITAMVDNSNVCMKRKLNNSTGKLLIIGMSANSDAISKQEALNAGMDNFICKPFTYQMFAQMSQSYM